MPASHTQSTTLWLPAGELDSVGHVVHEDSVAAPTVLEYLPAAHRLHADSAAAPSVIEYVPLQHGMHVSESDTPWYLPGSHKAHIPPSPRDEPALHVHAERLRLPAGEFEFAGHGWQAPLLTY